MFFDRPLAQSGVRRVSAKPKTQSQSSQARRRGAMIALAVAVGSPASMWSTMARAATPAGGPQDETYRPAAAPRPFIGVVPAFLAEQPKAFFTIPHFDGYAAVLIQLKKATKRPVREALTDGWLACAPPRLVEQFLET